MLGLVPSLQYLSPEGQNPHNIDKSHMCMIVAKIKLGMHDIGVGITIEVPPWNFGV